MDDAKSKVRKRVVAIVAHCTGIEHSRLSDDADLYLLGVIGDDAFALLVQLHERLGIDLTSLDFNRHFTGEGASFFNLAWLAVGILPIVGITVGFGEVFGKPGAWVIGLLIGLSLLVWWVIGACVDRRFGPHGKWMRERVPVTIGDLVEAGLSGKWSKPYPT